MASRPHVKEGIGEKSEFKQLGLQLKNPKVAEFEVDTNVFDIQLKSPGGIKTICNVTQYGAGGTETELKNAVLVQIKDDIITYHVAVSQTGWYKMNVFASLESNKDNSLPCVYTYLFNVKKTSEPVFRFPKQFADWTSGCYLYTPMWIGNLKDFSSVKFRLDVPGASRVAVKSGDEWTHLQKESEGGVTWSGDVCLTHHVKNKDSVVVNACTTSDQTSFASLLLYEFN